MDELEKRNTGDFSLEDILKEFAEEAATPEEDDVLIWDGNIPPESLKILAQIGAWMEKNGDSIRACGGIDFTKPVVLTYAGDLADGTVQKYLDDSKDIYGDHVNQLTIGQLGCVIGTHSGPGAIVVSFVPAE